MQIALDFILTLSVAAVSNIPSDPVYLPLSSLLPRKPSQPRASSNVVSLDPSVFSHPIRRDILHLCVVHHRDGLRQGTAANKTRAEVSGSSRKLRPQKGTGAARVGERGSPIRRGGGRTFAKKARDFSTKLPRKVREMGMRVALSAKLNERALSVVESLDWSSPKTKELKQRLDTLAWNKKVLFVSAGGVPKSLARSSGNLQEIKCLDVGELNVYEAVMAKRIVMDVGAVEWLENWLAKSENAVKPVAPPSPTVLQELATV